MKINAKKCSNISLNSHFNFIFSGLKHIVDPQLVWCYPDNIINIDEAETFSCLQNGIDHRTGSESSTLTMSLEVLKPTEWHLSQSIQVFIHLKDIVIVNIMSGENPWEFHISFFV